VSPKLYPNPGISDITANGSVKPSPIPIPFSGMEILVDLRAASAIEGTYLFFNIINYYTI